MDIPDSIQADQRNCSRVQGCGYHIRCLLSGMQRSTPWVVIGIHLNTNICLLSHINWADLDEVLDFRHSRMSSVSMHIERRPTALQSLLQPTLPSHLKLKLLEVILSQFRKYHVEVIFLQQSSHP